ncbi:MAG: hypothetical protein H7A09_06885 [Oceanospirillaceae bacterium]|nr:hypothetical protein [Oceanospirillaceae bacterium]MCP5335776.1 hypothetical protein [Oceanospirillaceae bacterium]MCP5349928.1 hypothetical protein [Oceanospirillaceae bacterium]
MKVVKIVAVGLSLVVLAGCSTRLGQFTAASSMNVRNLEYSLPNNTAAHTEGDSCIHTVFVFPIGNKDDRIQRALDNAIQNGRQKGIDGDLLVNARIDHSAWWAFLYGQDCVSVEGDLVKLNK